MSKLTDEQVEVFLSKLTNWRFENNCLIKTYLNNSFKDSIALVAAVADLAEKANHHPDLLIQYDKVTVTLTTHDHHGVTGKDFSLAQQVDAVYDKPIQE